MPKKILPADQHERGQHDGEDRVLLVGHSSWPASARSARFAGGGAVQDVRRRNPRSVGRMAAPRRRAGRPAHSHARRARPVAADSLTISRRRRRTRLRSTALPTFLDTVKPTRTGPLSPRVARLQHETRGRRPWPRSRRPGNPLVASAAPWTTPAALRPTSGAEPLAAARAARGDHLAAARGRHAGAKTVTALAHQLARLIGPLHGSFSAGR